MLRPDRARADTALVDRADLSLHAVTMTRAVTVPCVGEASPPPSIRIFAARGAALTSLAHPIDVAFLEEAIRRTRKDGAPGIDGRNAVTFAANL